MVSIETMDNALTPQVLTLLPATSRAVAKALGIERVLVTAILMSERKKKLTEIKEKGGKIWSIVGAQQQLPLKPAKSLRTIDYNVSKRQGIYPELKELSESERKAIARRVSGAEPKSLMVEVAELSVRVKQLEKFVGIVR